MAAERRAPRIALLEPAGRGGIHHYTRALAAALAERGADVRLFTARDHEFAARDRVSPPPFRVVRLFRRRQTSPVAVVRALRAFVPDVLHLQAGTHPLLHLALLLAAKAATGAPAIVTAHDLVPKNATRLGALAAALLQRCAARVIVHAEALARELAARVPAVAARVRIVPHGEQTLFAPMARGASAGDDGSVIAAEPTLLFFGYLHAEKGLPDLIEALPAIAARVPAVRLVIAGKPELDVAPLVAQAERLGVAQRIEWQLGYVDERAIAPLFSRATAVVLPYRQASQSGVLFLAGAFERPVVATRVGALAEAIGDGRSGRLVPARAPAELADACSELLSDPELAREMGKAHGIRCRTDGAWRAIAHATLALYAEVAPRCALADEVARADAGVEGESSGTDGVTAAREPVVSA